MKNKLNITPKFKEVSSKIESKLTKLNSNKYSKYKKLLDSDDWSKYKAFLKFSEDSIKGELKKDINRVIKDLKLKINAKKFLDYKYNIDNEFEWSNSSFLENIWFDRLNVKIEDIISEELLNDLYNDFNWLKLYILKYDFEKATWSMRATNLCTKALKDYESNELFTINNRIEQYIYDKLDIYLETIILKNKSYIDKLKQRKIDKENTVVFELDEFWNEKKLFLNKLKNGIKKASWERVTASTIE